MKSIAKWFYGLVALILGLIIPSCILIQPGVYMGPDPSLRPQVNTNATTGANKPQMK